MIVWRLHSKSTGDDCVTSAKYVNAKAQAAGVANTSSLEAANDQTIRVAMMPKGYIRPYLL